MIVKQIIWLQWQILPSPGCKPFVSLTNLLKLSKYQLLLYLESWEGHILTELRFVFPLKPNLKPT